jgi:DNA-binding protein HU-beta
MTKADFVKRVARAADLTNDQASRAVQAVLDELELALKAGDEVQFSGFGKFSVSHRAARQGVDPRNPGQKINIPARKVPRFQAGAQLKRSVAG